MAITRELVGSGRGLVHPTYTASSLWSQSYKQTKKNKCRNTWVACGKIPRSKTGSLKTRHFSNQCVASAGRNHPELIYNNELNPEPSWLSLIKEVAWSLKSLSTFLCEQPSQLRYIEWPSFQSTLKTATLTLVIVALLIVALFLVDSGLYYVMSWFLRRSS